MDSALEITSGAELLRFDLGTLWISGTQYTVLTGYEGTGRCFWCGGELKGKLKRYCRGHMKEYYRYFEWASARDWCIDRQEGICANCGAKAGEIIGVEKHGWFLRRHSLQVHHIVPLDGMKRFFSAFNLPWNLMALCHGCHQEVHAVMRGANKPVPSDIFELAVQRGQSIMEPIISGGKICLENLKDISVSNPK